MTPDPNDSFTSEKYWDSVYERAEDAANEEPVECPECEGRCGWSSCCGEPMEGRICTWCKERTEKVICPTCKGHGEIEE